MMESTLDQESYYKKKFEKLSKPISHAIALKPVKTAAEPEKAYNDIRIEISNVNIFIQANE